MLEQSLLDELWDFNDPKASEERLRAAMDEEGRGPEERAELATQVARALGLQDRFEEAEVLLAAQQDADYPVVDVRVLLERGRLKTSAGLPQAAVPLLETASMRAAEHRLHFLGIDALHMLAIADPEQAEAWTERGLSAVEAATGSPGDVARIAAWRVSLLNNLAWHRHDGGDYEGALADFQRARDAAFAVGTARQQFQARWAVARALRSIGAYDEALDIQERLIREDPTAEYVRAELRELARARGV